MAPQQRRRRAAAALAAVLSLSALPSAQAFAPSSKSAFTSAPSSSRMLHNRGRRKPSSSSSASSGSSSTRLNMAFDPSFLQDIPSIATAAAAHASTTLDLGSGVNHVMNGLGSVLDSTTTFLSQNAAVHDVAQDFTAGVQDLTAGVASAMDSATAFLSHGHGGEHHAHAVPEFDKEDPFQVLIHSPLPWSVVVMLSIVGLLYTWEEAVESLREGLPEALTSVVDSMLAEMGGLGFIGLFLQLFVTGGVLGGVVGELSETFLGEEEILLETFEFLHTVFFQVGIGFFAICGLTVFAVLKRIKELGKISELALDTDGDGEVSLEEMADALHVEAMVVDENGDGVLDEEEITSALRKAKKLTVAEEIKLGDEERGAEALVVRERLIRNLGLPDDFKVQYYFEKVFAHQLEEIVEFSPLTWVPLIPLIALDDTVDLSHGVISAASANAADSSGWFFGTPWFFFPALAAQVACVAWGLFNLWKMTSVKVMLLPTLVRDGADDGPALLLPPRYEDPVLLENFDSSPNIFGWFERTFLPKKEPTNDHQRLFGAPGGAGPRLYRDSIKFHTWLCVAQIVFFGGQIVLRDAWALLNPETVAIGCPEFVYQELVVFSAFVLLSAAQLALAPTTFLNYCFSSSIETMVDVKMMAQAEKESHEAFAKEAEQARLAEEERRLESEEKAFEDRIANGEDVCVITEEGKRAKSGANGEMDEDECGGALTTAADINGSGVNVNGDAVADAKANGNANGEKSNTKKEGCVECEGAATNSALLETAAKYREQCEKLEKQSEEVDAEGQRLEVQMATEEEIPTTLTPKLDSKEAETKATAAPTAGATTSAPKETKPSTTSTSLSAKNQALLEKKRRMQKMGF